MPILDRRRAYVIPDMGAAALASSCEQPATPPGQALPGFMALFRLERGISTTGACTC